jgi:alpha-glucosidase
MKFKICLLLCFATLAKSAIAQKDIRLVSPNKKISCTINYGSNGIYYSASLNKQVLVDRSALTLYFSGKDFLKNAKILKPEFTNAVEKYDLLIGKTKHVEDAYTQVSIPLQEKETPFKKVNIIFRAFNDGLAFRYEMIGQKGTDSFQITDEHCEFRLTGDPVVKALFLPNFTSSHEGFYTTKQLDALPSDSLMDMPALIQYSGKAYMAITEAALLDYAGMYLTKKNNVLRSELSPLPSDKTVKVKMVFPHVSPWRVMLISDKVGDLLSSSLITSLAPANMISDTSWIHPGKTTFPWWNGNVTPDTLNAPGNNFVTQQYYIDFCARNNIQYHTVVEYGLHQWYVDDGVGFQPGPHSDVTTPVPGLDMKEVCDYAHSKGVGVRVWVHWAALYPKLDSAFAAYEKWGLSGMMIDFMDRDDQQMVNIQTEMLEKAAKHKLHIQFHGAYKPTGLSRTWPNEFTREGTLNYEVNKWGSALPPLHDLDIVFTRLIAGSTDYHLGGFRAVPDSLYVAQYTRPLMLGTRCHMLGMYVVLENALGMACDYPAAYEGENGFDFIKDVPTTWDETKVLEAKVDEYIVTARRKGNNWYIGSINNATPRDISLSLSFLQNGSYNMKMYSDHPETHVHPNKITFKEQQITAADKINFRLAPNGGAAIEILQSGK